MWGDPLARELDGVRPRGREGPELRGLLVVVDGEALDPAVRGP